MIVVEIYSPVYDEEAGSEQLRWRATIKATRGGRIEIQGDRVLVADGELPIRDNLGRQLLAAQDPEDWARNLPQAFRAGDLVAQVVYDDSDPVQGPEREPAPHIEPPTVPGTLAGGVIARSC